MTTRADVVACARAFVAARIKWKHQGASRLGVDCIGLIGVIAAELGLSDVWVTDASAPYKGYGRQPDPAKIYRACAQFLRPVTPKENAVPGDILLLRFEEEPMHFAILSALDPPYMVHAYTQAKRVVENRIDELWASRIVCAYQYRGIT